MPSNPNPGTFDPRTFHHYLIDDNVSVPQKCQFIRNAREASRENSEFLDIALVRMVQRLRKSLHQTSEYHENLERLFGELDEAYRGLTEPPLYPATFLERRTIAGVPTALVHCADSSRFVRLGGDFDGSTLEVGEHVLLSGDQNLIVDRLASPSLECGETATFECYAPDGRLVLSNRGDMVIVSASAGLDQVALEHGDHVRWNPKAWVAYEKVETSTSEQFFLDETVAETFDDIGGLDSQIETLKNIVLLHLEHPDLTSSYDVPPQRAALMEGPPGTGKTMLAKALVNFLKEISPSGKARFINVKPGQFSNMWYGQTEATIRKFFAEARRAAESQPDIPVVMFLDEIDGLASARGGSFNHVDDRALVAFGVELDGLCARGNVLVIAATNRMDILDPAMTRPGRFGDEPIQIGRPKRAGAHAILTKYFRERMPYASGNGNGSGTSTRRSAGANAREEIIDSTLSRLYSPNGDGDVATITFRDGSRRVVRMHELSSGAVLAKIARSAARRACLREIHTGARGIELADVFAAIDKEIETMGRILTPANCSRYLDDLPFNAPIVGVEPVKRKPARVHRFMQVA